MAQRVVSDDETPRLGEERSTSTAVRSVEKAIDILDLLVKEKNGLRLSEVAERLEMSPSTAHHLMATLKGRGLVSQTSRSKAYRIGYRLLAMAREVLNETEVYPAAIGPAEALRDRSGETTYLTVFQEREIVTILTLDGRGPIQARRVFRPAGTNLHSTASGKLFLANLPAAHRERLLATLELTPFTPNTVTDLDALRAELDRVREQGFSEDRQEDFVGLQCIAAPVVDAHGTCVAAISVSYPAAPEPRTRELVGQVRSAAASVSDNLGGANAHTP